MNYTSVTDPLGRVTSYEYDPLNRVTKTTLPDPDTSDNQPAPFTLTTYDHVGNVSSTTDANGAVTSYQYDARGRVIRILSPLSVRKESPHSSAA